MPQARTISDKDLKILLATIAQNRHAARNRAKEMMSYQAGMRVGEIAALRVCDVASHAGNVSDHINLAADQTKRSHGRTVLLGDKLRKEYW